jgi:integrase/recombinase XerC
MMSQLLQLTNQPASLADIAERDLLQELIADRRSPNTRRTYTKALLDFFLRIANTSPTPQLVREFLQLDRYQAMTLVLRYRRILTDRGLAPSTINTRLAAIKSLVTYARKVGECQYDLGDVEGVKVETYRDTSGVNPQEYQDLMAVVDRESVKGMRDYAILRLLWDNALRRGEICQANVGDFDPVGGKLWIIGKGKVQRQPIDLSSHAIAAIRAWLEVRGKYKRTDPLFCTLDRATKGHRLSGNALYNLVRDTGAAAGIYKVMSPHRVRHSAITAALDATNGDTRRVQKLSRHADLNTLTRYDDNRRHHQGEVTKILADLV